MDSKIRYLNMEKSLREYIPNLNHHVKESLYRPEENFLKIKNGETVVRTIKEEDADTMWHAASKALESFAFSYFEKEASNV